DRSRRSAQDDSGVGCQTTGSGSTVRRRIRRRPVLEKKRDIFFPLRGGSQGPKVELTLARELGEYVRTVRYRDLGSETVREIKRRIVDSLGCAIGAFDARPVRIARLVAGNMKAVRGATIM